MTWCLGAVGPRGARAGQLDCDWWMWLAYTQLREGGAITNRPFARLASSSLLDNSADSDQGDRRKIFNVCSIVQNISCYCPVLVLWHIQLVRDTVVGQVGVAGGQVQACLSLTDSESSTDAE
jgi:hypothetical protein